MAGEALAGFDQTEGLRGVDAQGVEHLGREDFAHAALEGQATVALARPGRASAAFGRQIQQALGAGALLGLSEEEAAAVTKIGVVALELMAVIAKGDRSRQ